MHVDLNQPYVVKLWDEISGLLQADMAWMVPLLNLFGVEEGNGLSTFAGNIKTPGDLVRLIEKFFRTPWRYPRGPNNKARTRNLGDNEVDDVEMEALDEALLSENKEDLPSLALPNYTELSPDVIAGLMQDIALEDKESGSDIEISNDKDDEYIVDQEKSDSVGTSDIYYTVENEDFSMEATVVNPTHSSRLC